MPEFPEGIGSASVRAFWAPVVAWTGLAGVAVVVLARVRGLHPIAGYRLRQALLLALPVSVLAAPWVPGLLPVAPAPVSPVLSADGVAMAPSVTGGVVLAADGPPGADIALVLLGAATLAIVLPAIGRLASWRPTCDSFGGFGGWPRGSTIRPRGKCCTTWPNKSASAGRWSCWKAHPHAIPDACGGGEPVGAIAQTQGKVGNHEEFCPQEAHLPAACRHCARRCGRPFSR